VKKYYHNYFTKSLNQFKLFYSFQFIIVYGLIGYEPLTYEDYQYPLWANVLGWGIAGSSVLMIPGVALFKIITTPGTLSEVQNRQIIFSSLNVYAKIFVLMQYC
jgi:hypothetical protein